jgi:hypothetical protein
MGACLEAKRVCGERQQLLALTDPASVLSGSGIGRLTFGWP